MSAPQRGRRHPGRDQVALVVAVILTVGVAIGLAVLAAPPVTTVVPTPEAFPSYAAGAAPSFSAEVSPSGSALRASPGRSTDGNGDAPVAGASPATSPRAGRVEPSAAPGPSEPAEPAGPAGPAERGPPVTVPTEAAELAAEVEDLVRPGTATPPTVFRVASFNVLGHSHTTARGNKPSYASGVVRMKGTVALLRALDIDVVGLQEFEAPQYEAFRRETEQSWGVFPGMSLGGGPVRNSIAFDLDTWAAVDSGTIPVPYFAGNRVPMPWILLQDVRTGRQVHVINIHNPVSSAKRGDNERWRDLGTAMEVALVERLQARAPVILMGDFNERAEAFCTVTSGAGMRAANGGSTRPCRPPTNAGIDWIFGTPDISFDGYQRLSSPAVRRASDHPLILASARIGS